jgi:phytoene/squalene synthetase
MTLQACADLVARGDPDRFRATMAAPVPARRVLFPLYAFNIEVTRAPWVTAEPPIAEMRLQFWRDTVAEIAAGAPARAHEVAVPLSEAIPASLIGALDALIEARRWDIYKEAFEDAAEFDGYLEATSGLLVSVAARALGAPPSADDALRQAGWAFGLASYLQAIPALEASGRVPLLDGRPAAIRDLADDGLSRLTEARRRLRDLPVKARPALFAGWRARAVLRRVKAEPERVAAGGLQESDFRRRAHLAWVAATGRW